MSFPFNVQRDKPLSELSTFRIGGRAQFLCEVDTIESMQLVLLHCCQKRIPYLLLGKGSNCLFDDRGFEGLVILNKINFCRFEGDLVEVGAGYSFSLLGAQTARKGWSGLEFASGIPGSVGGAIYMNAGASGADTQKVLNEVSYVNEQGELELLPKEKLHFAYRTSSFQQRRGAIVAARFQLTPSEEARQKQLAIIGYRQKTQPYDMPSAGCVFRNPDELSAGALIQQAGLKGLRIGDAEVSLQHANFIVNRGNATAKEVWMLVKEVKRRVKEQTGHELEMEVRVMPYRLETFWDV